MKHKIWVNLIVVLALVLGSGGVMLDGQPAAQAAPTASEDYVWHIGGPALSVAVTGEHAYLGEGFGLTILDISIPSAPEVVGRLEFLPDIVHGVAVAGNYAYVADGESGLRVIDVSDPTDPSEVGFYDTHGSAGDVAVVGDYAYVADGSFGLWVFDISDPTSPTEVGFYNTPGSASDVAVSGDYAYVADYGGGLRVVDVSNPASPSEVGYSNPWGVYAEAVAMAEGFAYVAAGSYGLRVIDVSDPSTPFGVGSTYMGRASDVAVAGSYAFVTDVDDSTGSGLRVVNVSNPAIPSEVGFYDTPGDPMGVAVEGGYAYVADGYEGGLGLIDINDPTNPSEVSFYYAPGDAWGVAVEGEYAYVTEGRGGRLGVIDVSDPAHSVGVGFTTIAESNSVVAESYQVAVAGGYAYVAAGSHGLRVIDVNSPPNPIEFGFTPTWGLAYDVAVAGDFAYVADGEVGGLGVIDVTDPASPNEVGWYDTPGDAQGVAVSGSYAYVADGGGGLRVIDVSEPVNPSEVGWFDTPSSAYRVTVAASYAYVLAGGLHVIDVSDPTSPSQVGFYDATLGGGSGVVVEGNYAFVTDWYGLRVIDVSDPTYPSEAGSFDAPSEALGVAMEGNYAFVADRLGGLIILDYTKLDLKDRTNTIITGDAPDPSQVGQPISVSFEVTAASGTPSGTVTLTVANEMMECVGALTGGVGACEITLGDPGTYTLTATYSGDGNFLESRDVEEHEVVGELEHTATTILSDEPDPSQVGQEITVIFEVTAESGVPSGVVNVTVYNEAENCSGTLNGGIGECKITLDNPGTYTLAASYQGDDTFQASSAMEAHTVVPKQLVPVFLPLVIKK
jgi:hypothetical protein